MIPSWVTNTLIVILGCIFAIYIGTALPQYDFLGFYLVGSAIVCTFCIVSNNFPFLIALAMWFPFPPPIPGFHNFPTITLVMAWCGVLLFLRVCMTRSLNYVPSCNLVILLCFLWVPIRFMMNPVHSLGANVSGGHGVSGANAYFTYALAGVIVIGLGSILNTRVVIFNYLWWSFVWCLIIGVILLACAFTPATAPFLTAMGMFAAGDMGDGVQRIVILPGYGLLVLQSGLCRDLFHLSRFWAFVCCVLGFTMIVVGGNRSALIAAAIAIPVILLLRKKTYALLITLASYVAIIAAVHVVFDQMNASEIPLMARSLGTIDSKIDDVTGGKASADWRYQVWQSGIDKIKEAPFTGKGFGNLDKRFEADPNGKPDQADFETILAGGESHNGFISAAYGFGIPFMLCLSVLLVWRMLTHMRSALVTDPKDPELRDFHAFLGGSFSTVGILIYTAFDMSVLYFWVYVGIGIVIDRLTRGSKRNVESQVNQTSLQSRESTPLFPGSLIQKY